MANRLKLIMDMDTSFRNQSLKVSHNSDMNCLSIIVLHRKSKWSLDVPLVWIVDQEYRVTVVCVTPTVKWPTVREHHKLLGLYALILHVFPVALEFCTT